jgi:hypothetical protein
MSKSQETQKGKTPTAHFREYQRGQTSKTPVVEPWAGLVRKPDEDLFLALSEAFRDEGSFRAKDIHDRLLRASASKNAARAIRQDDRSTLQNFVGETGDRRDMSGVPTLRKIQDSISRPAYVAYIFGKMGDGKTDFALLLSELWADAKRQKNYEVEVASNIKTWENSETIRRFDDFLEWLEVEDDADFSSKRRLFVFDEASSHASGYSEDADDARRMGKLVNVIRKKMASIIIIGHTGKDVHPDIRRKATHFIKKESLKEAYIATPETDEQGKMSPEKQVELKGIPKTNETFETDEESRWAWGDSDRDSRIEKMLEVGLSQKDVAYVEDLTEGRISQIKSELAV